MYLGITAPPEKIQLYEVGMKNNKHFNRLPNSALPKTGKNRRAVRTAIQITQQMEKTNTLNDKSPAFTVKGRF